MNRLPFLPLRATTFFLVIFIGSIVGNKSRPFVRVLERAIFGRILFFHKKLQEKVKKEKKTNFMTYGIGHKNKPTHIFTTAHESYWTFQLLLVRFGEPFFSSPFACVTVMARETSCSFHININTHTHWWDNGVGFMLFLKWKMQQQQHYESLGNKLISVAGESFNFKLNHFGWNSENFPWIITELFSKGE